MASEVKRWITSSKFLVVARGARGLLLVAASLIVLGCSGGAEHSTGSTSATPAQGDSAQVAVAADEAPRIVVLISLDTVRADHLSLYGYDRFTSPNLDTLSVEATVFEDATTPAPWTLPSHASMLSGLYPLTHGSMTVRNGIDESVPTLASLLAEAGFDTAAIVNSTWLKRETFKVTHSFSKYVYVPDQTDKRSPNRWVTDQVLRWLRERGDTPLFVFAHYYDAHSDYTSEPAYEKLFVPEYEGIADGTSWQLAQLNFDPRYIEMCIETKNPKTCRFGPADEFLEVNEDVKPIELDEAFTQHLLNLYDAGVRQLDDELSRLFAAMRREGILDEALIIITSDHGEAFGEHGYFEHFLTLHQEVTHIPLVMLGPGVPKGLRISTPVSGIDIAPTVLSFLGLPIPGEMEGLDLRPLMLGESPPAFAERLLFSEAAGGLTHKFVGLEEYFPYYRAVRDGRWKLLYEKHADEYELYDLDADPRELNNLALQRPEIRARLAAAMDRRYAEFDAGGSVGSAPVVELDEEQLERLRALGYAL